MPCPRVVNTPPARAGGFSGNRRGDPPCPPPDSFRGCPGYRGAARRPVTRRIAGVVRQPVGIVHVLISGEPTEDGLPDLRRQGVAAVPAGPGLGESLCGRLGQAKGIVELPERRPASDVAFEP